MEFLLTIFSCGKINSLLITYLADWSWCLHSNCIHVFLMPLGIGFPNLFNYEPQHKICFQIHWVFSNIHPFQTKLGQGKNTFGNLQQKWGVNSLFVCKMTFISKKFLSMKCAECLPDKFITSSSLIWNSDPFCSSDTH